MQKNIFWWPNLRGGFWHDSLSIFIPQSRFVGQQCKMKDSGMRARSSGGEKEKRSIGQLQQVGASSSKMVGARSSKNQKVWNFRMGKATSLRLPILVVQGAIGPWQEGIRGDTLARWCCSVLCLATLCSCFMFCVSVVVFVFCVVVFCVVVFLFLLLCCVLCFSFCSCVCVFCCCVSVLCLYLCLCLSFVFVFLFVLLCFCFVLLCFSQVDFALLSALSHNLDTDIFKPNSPRQKKHI